MASQIRNIPAAAKAALAMSFSLQGKAHYRYSDHPFHGWKVPADDRVLCASVPKGALWEDKILFAGYSAPPKCYAGTMTFRFATASETGELIFL